MSFTKMQQDQLEAALANRALKEQLLNEIQLMRDNFNGVLAKLDADTGVFDTNYSALFSVPNIRLNGKITRL